MPFDFLSATEYGIKETPAIYTIHFKCGCVVYSEDSEGNSRGHLCSQERLFSGKTRQNCLDQIWKSGWSYNFKTEECFCPKHTKEKQRMVEQERKREEKEKLKERLKKDPEARALYRLEQLKKREKQIKKSLLKAKLKKRVDKRE